jgi:hypothetical protein
MGLPAVGGLTVACALLLDWIRQRFARRRRCPKCWYDLSHTPGLRCSECGYTAKRERTLLKAKRRWGVAALGVLLLVGSYAAHVTPAVQDRGWPAAVPMAVKILLIPVIRPSHENVTKYSNGSWVNTTATGFYDLGVQDRLFLGLLDDFRFHARNKSLRPIHHRLQRLVAYEELVSHELATIEWQIPSHLALSSARWRDREPFDWESITPTEPVLIRAESRSQWSRGVPLRVWIDIDAPTDQQPHVLLFRTRCGTYERRLDWRRHESQRGRWSDRSVELWPIDDPDCDLDVVVVAVHEQSVRFIEQNPNPMRRRIVWPKQPLSITVDIVGDIAMILEPVESPEFTTLLGELAKPELHLGLLSSGRPHGGSPYGGTLSLRNDGGRSYSQWRRPEFAPFLKGFTFAAALEVRADGETVGHGGFWMSHDFPWLPLKYHPYGSRGIRFEADYYLSFMSVTIEMNPEWRMTNDNRDAHWTLVIRGDPETALLNANSDRYWSGEVEIALTIKGPWLVMPERLTLPSRSHPDIHPESR